MPSKTSKRVRYKSKSYSKKSFSKSNKQLKKVIKQVANQSGEKKYFTVYSGGPQTVDSIGVVTSISNIGQGDTDVTRDGDQVYLRSIELTWNAIVADTYNFLRLIIFQWMPASTPTVSDILIPATGNPEQNYQMPYNHDGRFNFRILYDRTLQVSQDTYQSRQVTKKYILKGFRHRIQYQAGTTDGNNKIYLLKISDSTAASHPTMMNVTKINFGDM